MTLLGDRFVGLAKHDQTQVLERLVRQAMTEPNGFLAMETGVELPPELLPTVESAAAYLWSRLAGVPFEGLPEPGRFSEWQTERLDLDGYLRWIGITERPEPTLGSLRAVLSAHSMAIGFDNTDVLLGRPLSFELADIQHKVLGTGRGLVCTEHNLLLAAALERLGFAVTRLGGRPRIGRPVVLPLTHMALLVEVDGGQWLVDGGLGGEAITEPVALAGAVAAGRWRVRTEGDQHVLQVLHMDRDRWVDLYSFDLHPQRYVDYLLGHYYSVTYPGIPVAKMLVAHRVSPGERHVVTGTRYTLSTVDDKRTSTQLDFDGLAALLTEVFELALTETELKTIWQQA